MRLFRPRNRFLFFALSFFLLPWAAQAFGDSGTNPGDTPPLPLSTGLTTWEDVSATWVMPDPDNSESSRYRVHWLTYNYKANSWSDSEIELGEAIGGKSVNAPVAVAAGRIYDITRDSFATAAYLASDGSTVKVRLENIGFVLLDAGDGVKAPDKRGDLTMVAADLDALVEEDGTYHDEVVVLYDYFNAGQASLRLAVIDHHGTVLATYDIASPAPAFIGSPGASLAAADVDGDGKKEVLVGYWHNYSKYYPGTYYPVLAAYRLSNGTLTGSSIKTRTSHYNEYPSKIGIATGDFNDDGYEEAFVGTSDIYAYNSYYYLEYFFECYSFDATLTPTRRATLPRIYQQSQYSTMFDNPFPPGCNNFFSLAAGRFKTPGPTDGILRRQLAVAYYNPYVIYGSYVMQIYEIREINGTWKVLDPHTAPPVQTADLGGGDIQLLPGNFKGKQNTGPTMDVGLFISSTAGSTFSAWKVNPDTLDFSSSGHYFKKSLGKMPSGFSGTLGIAKADRNGDPDYDPDRGSTILGPPSHILMENVIMSDAIIEEPPKHVDYLPPMKMSGTDETPDWDNSEWGVIIPSRTDKITCEYEAASDTSTKQEAKSHASGSAGVDAGITSTKDWGLSLEGLFFGKDETTSLDLKYSFSQAFSMMDSYGVSASNEVKASTTKDDSVLYSICDVDVWRYPIFGYNKVKPNQAYYDVNYPIITVNSTVNSPGMECSELYQPVHINGNVLSYPSSATKAYDGNLGSFAVGDSEIAGEYLNDVTSFPLGGTQNMWSVKWSTTLNSEKAKSWEQNLGGEVDFKFSFKSKFKMFDGHISDDWSEEFKTDLKADASWGLSTTQSSELSTRTSLTMTVGSDYIILPGWGYTITPRAYISKAGGSFKVQHYADFNQNSTYFKKYYGSRPDPALSLPHLYVSEKDPNLSNTDSWDLNKGSTSRNLRGLFVSTWESHPATGLTMDVGMDAVDGDVLKIAARVYNLSLVPCDTPFDVTFQYVQVGADDSEIGERKTIGTCRILRMDPQDMKEASIQWKTAGLGPKVPNQYNQYRFWVTVDQEQKVKPVIHPLGSACDNKRGFWPWTGGFAVYAPNSTKPAVLPSGFNASVKVGLRAPGGALQTRWGTVPSGQFSKLGVAVTADAAYSRKPIVIFYDWALMSGKPQETVAHRMLHPVAWDSRARKYLSHGNADWRPMVPGLHYIFASLANVKTDAETHAPTSPRGSGIFVWVASASPQQDLELLDGAVCEVSSRREKLAEEWGEPLCDQLQQQLHGYRTELLSRLETANRLIQNK